MAYYSKKVLPGEVRDEQGRRRLHGAFTGGWSAGFYNTVGSAEGWAPSTFVSSRDRQAQEQATVQRPEDFMDEEDGLLGHAVSTSSDYDTLGVAGKEQLRRQAEFEAQGLGNSSSEGSGDLFASSSEGGAGFQARRGLIPGASPLELMVVAGQPVGKRLLQTMGWREGTGVGARLAPGRQRKRSSAGASGARALSEDAAGATGEVSGRELGGSPVDAASRSRQGGEEAVEEEDSLWYHMPEGATLAPKDEDALLEVPPPKSDLYGIGYDPMVENPELERARRQAFGHRASGSSGGGASGRGSRTYAMGGGGAGNGASHAGQLDVGGFAVDDGDDDTYGSGPATFAAGDYDTEIGGDDDNDDDDHDHQLPLRLMASSSSASSGGLKSGGGAALGRGLNNNELLEAFGFAPPGTSLRGGDSGSSTHPSGSSSNSGGAQAPCADGKPPLPGFALGGVPASSSSTRSNSSGGRSGGNSSVVAHGEKHWPPPVVPRGFHPTAHLPPKPKTTPAATAPAAATAAAAMQPSATVAHEVGAAAVAAALVASQPSSTASAGRGGGGGGSSSGSGAHGRLTASDRSKLLGEEARTIPPLLAAAGAGAAAAGASSKTLGASATAGGVAGSGEAGTATAGEAGAPSARPMLTGRGGGAFLGLASLGQAMSNRFTSTKEVLTAEAHGGGLTAAATAAAGDTAGATATSIEVAAEVAAARALLGGSVGRVTTTTGTNATPPTTATTGAKTAATASAIVPTVPLPPPKPPPVVSHRTSTEWRPDRLLCQRFNVPPPTNATTAAAVAAAAAAANPELARQMNGKGGKGSGKGVAVAPTLSRDGYQEHVAPFLAGLSGAAATSSCAAAAAAAAATEENASGGTVMPPPPPRFAAQDLLAGLTDSPPPTDGVDRTPTPPPVGASATPSLDTEVAATKPSVDFFKAIFEPSSEEEEESSEDENDEEEEAMKVDGNSGVGEDGRGSKAIAQPGEPSAVQPVPMSRPSVAGPMHPFARLAADRQLQQPQQPQPQQPFRGPIEAGSASSATIATLPEALSKETLLSLARNSSSKVASSSSSSSSDDGSSDGSSDGGRKRKRKDKGKAKKKEKKRHKKRAKKQKKHKHKSDAR